MVSRGLALHVDNGFNVRLPVHCMTVARGGVTLLSAFVVPAPLRALALYFKTMEGMGSLMMLPDIVRAFWIKKRADEGLSLSCMHSARACKALLIAARFKLAPLFTDLLHTIDAVGRVIGSRVEQDRLRDAHKIVTATDIHSNGNSKQQYIYAKWLEVAMHTAAVAALIMPLVVTSTWGGHFVLLVEVTYASLCILHYLYQGHATRYAQALRGPEEPDEGGEGPPDCSDSKPGGDCQGFRMEASLIAAAPSSRQEEGEEENTGASLMLVGSDLNVTGAPREDAPQ